MSNHSSAVPARILLVDDNPTNLKVLFQTLEALGHKLLIAKSGEDALTIAQRARPALILLDIMMPGIDGFETCRRLKANPETAETAIIFLSALDDTHDKVTGLSLGAVDYIAKPFQAEEVLARVETHLTIYQLRTQLAESNRQLKSANQHILAAVGEGIYGLDIDGNITFANPAAAELTGYTKDEMIGESLHRLHLANRFDGSAYPYEQTPLSAVLDEARKVISEDEVFWRKDGSHFPIALSCAPILRDGALQGAVVAFQDITERKRQEQKLRDALSQVEDLRDRLAAENAYLQAEVKHEGGFDGIVGDTEALHKVLAQIRQVAPTNSSVLITGESGTGKEALARAIHELSSRRDRPLIKVNCGAITPSLIESELFGHEKGSFTGAFKRRLGHFEVANGGTIFLDEIGELPLDAQVKLLRVLQEHEFNRIGSEEAIRVDVRVIAATNRDLAKMVDDGKFRMDLFYRLNVFPLQVPPLRERRADIPLLVDKFMQQQARSLGKLLERIDDQGMQLLNSYDWPGNIRELQNVIERAAILATEPVMQIDPALVYSGIRVPGRPAGQAPGAPSGLAEQPEEYGEMLSLSENEARHIRRVLDQTNWIIAGRGGAAEVLGVPASTLRSRMKKLGVERPD